MHSSTPGHPLWSSSIVARLVGLRRSLVRYSSNLYKYSENGLRVTILYKYSENGLRVTIDKGIDVTGKIDAFSELNLDGTRK